MEGTDQVQPESVNPTTDPAQKGTATGTVSYFHANDIAGQIWHLIVDSAADEDLFNEAVHQNGAVPVQLRLGIDQPGETAIQLRFRIAEPVDEDEDIPRSADF